MHRSIPELADATRTLMTARADALHLDAGRIASLRPLNDIAHDPVPALAQIRADTSPSAPLSPSSSLASNIHTISSKITPSLAF